MVNAGERFSFVVEANQTPGCYWMRFRGLGHCGPMMTYYFTVDSLMVNAGERFSFVVEANQTPGCYWMRFRGLGHCGPMMAQAHGEASVCYHGAISELTDNPTYSQGKRLGRMLNPVFNDEDYSEVEQISLSDLTGLEVEKYSYSGPPNVTIYLELNAKYY
ncbi:hypothetical protein J6590_046743, partial [Homalodisca vitripennis]